MPSRGYFSLPGVIFRIIYTFLGGLMAFWAVSRCPAMAVLPLSAYPLFYLLDMRSTYHQLYLPAPDEFARREGNVFLVAFERRLGFRRAAVLQTFVSFSEFIFISLFFVPIASSYLGVSTSLLERLAAGATAMATLHAHAWISNRACVSK